MTETSDRKHAFQWDPKRATSLAAAQRRAGIGRRMRVLFWVPPVLVVLIAVYFLVFSGGSLTEPVVSPAEGEAGVVRMEKLRFLGRDNQGDPFEVLAETAIRRPGQADNITELEFPIFIDGAEGADTLQARVDARRGVYDSDAEILELHADVDLSTESGYAFRTSHARYYIDERRAEGDEPVSGSGPFGTISADRWSFEEDGAVLHFEGNVRTVINTGSGEEDEQEDAGQ